MTIQIEILSSFNKAKPIAAQYGSKVHNNFYEPITTTEGSEATNSTARSVIKIIFH